MATLRIDVLFTDEEGVEQACAELAEGLDVQWRETGVNTAGGSPEIEFSGDHATLVTLANRYDETGHARLRVSAH